MNRLLSNTLLAAGLASVSSLALAGDWEFLPIKNPDYKADFTLSAIGGQMKPTSAASGSYVGVEAAFNCGMLQPPSGKMRTKISYGEYNKAGYRLNSFEVNPRWTAEVGDNLSIGAGPGIGYVSTNVAGSTTGLFALQLGADMDYRIGAMNLGLGVRWQGTENKLIAANQRGADNTLVVAKIGVNF